MRNFLSDCIEWVKAGIHLFTTISLNISSPLLYTLYTHDYVGTLPDNKYIKFAVDATIVGLISGGDDTAYSQGPVAGGVGCRQQLGPQNPQTKQLTNLQLI